MTISRYALFSRFFAKAKKALESAVMLAKVRSNAYVEPVHWLQILILDDEMNDVRAAMKYFGVDEKKLAQDAVRALGRLPAGASALADFANSIDLSLKEAWVHASLARGRASIRSGDVLCVMKSVPSLQRGLREISEEFLKINGDLLDKDFEKIVSESVEKNEEKAAPAAGAASSDTEAPFSGAAGEALSRFTSDMTEKARERIAKGSRGIVGRDAEIRKIIDILLRHRQNNPMITGEAGVGKTAVAEGFAERLASGDVPDALKGARLLALDVGLLTAGAGQKGEFESRIKALIEDVKNSDVPTLLFIDEAHTLIGAGGAAGTNDAANLLKPALARGELRCIAATTWAEYVKYFEKDPALSRRFQNVQVEEPDDAAAVEMLRSTCRSLERHHKVKILESALEAAVKLSRRYIPTRRLPDKAVSVLDTACARTALSAAAEPAELERVRRGLEALSLEADMLHKESALGIDHAKRLEEVTQRAAKLEAERKNLSEAFEKQKALNKEISVLREEVLKRIADAENVLEPRENAQASGSAEVLQTREELQAKLQQKRGELAALAGDRPMVFTEVNDESAAQVIAEWTGIPIGRMIKDEILDVLGLAGRLEERVIGQNHALELLADRIAVSRSGLGDPGKPIAVLMLAGPSGTGKTETALALAEALYGSEQSLIAINMSEFQEAHTVSTLKGAPPGYVGYGEGGVLTEAVRRRPYSVVLLDEIEKAHKDVHEIFFQVFDKGEMEDSAGRYVNFKNTVIILTTNVGDDVILERCEGLEGDKLPPAEELAEAIRPALRHVFPAALLGRLTVVPFYPLGRGVLERIVFLKLKKLQKRVAEHYGAKLITTQALADEILSRCRNAASGARLIDAVITNEMLPAVSEAFLRETLEGRKLMEATVDARGGEFVEHFIYAEESAENKQRNAACGLSAPEQPRLEQAAHSEAASAGEPKGETGCPQQEF